MSWRFSGGEGPVTRSGGTSSQVVSFSDGPHGPMQTEMCSRRALRASLWTMIYRVARWWALVTSTFPSQPQPQSVLTRHFQTSQTNSTIPLRLHSGKEWSRVARGDWLSQFLLPALAREQEPQVGPRDVSPPTPHVEAEAWGEFLRLWHGAGDGGDAPPHGHRCV